MFDKIFDNRYNSYTKKQKLDKSKSIKKLSHFLFIAGVIVATYINFLGFLIVVSSCIGYYTSHKLKRMAHKKDISFTPFDERGKKALVLRTADIEVVDDAQDVVKDLCIGDTVILQKAANEYDVIVYSEEMHQFGLLPEWNDNDYANIRLEVRRSLNGGAKVLAKVKNLYHKKNGNIGVIIEICRYAIR